MELIAQSIDVDARFANIRLAGKRLQRERALVRLADLSTADAEGSDRVREEVAYRVFDRICDVKRRYRRWCSIDCGRSSFMGTYLQSECSTSSCSTIRHASS